MRPKKTILCVNPCEFRLSRQVFLLETRGYRVLRAESGAEALRMLKAAPPGTIDVLVCELLMPDLDGNKLARRAKRLHRGLPVLMLSELVTDMTRNLEADVFLPKAANTPAEVVERIHTMSARRRGPKKKLLPAMWVTRERGVRV